MPTTTPAPPNIFDRRRYRAMRENAAANFHDYSFVFERVIDDIVDRLESTNRQFERALFSGASYHGFSLEQVLTSKCGVETSFVADIATRRLKGARQPCVTFDDEWLPIADNSVDLFVSVLSLHAVNDLIGTLIQAKRSLRPDGLFIGAMFGEDTLRALQKTFLDHDIHHCGGAHTRFSPTATMQSLGSAMQRAGFALPVVDKVSTTVQYKDAGRVFTDLKGMGERNYLVDRAKSLPRKVLESVLTDLDNDAKPIVFDVVMLTGWAPHENQQKPLEPGSAKQSLARSVLNNL